MKQESNAPSFGENSEKKEIEKSESFVSVNLSSVSNSPKNKEGATAKPSDTSITP